MSTQQYSQYPNLYYGLEHYPYHQYVNGGGQPLNSLGQTPAQGQTQGAQQLSSQYGQQPYGQYYMLNNQPGQQPIQGQQSGQYALYQQQGTQQSDYGAHYAGYGASSGSAPYGQYAMYQQGLQAPQALNLASSGTVPSAQLYTGAPAQQGAAQNAPASSSGTAATSQSGNVASSASSAAQSGASASYSEGLGSNSTSTVGQYQPPGIRPRVTTTMWEDEKTLCYQVDANNVSVVRRADNNMINGTKLLNVAQMTRGRRDGILKLEKIRHVVKIGSMHLKGVWIPFERALAMAQREGIVDLLYPLFVRDIKRVIQSGVTPLSQSSGPAAAAAPAAPAKQPSGAASYPGGTGAAGANYYLQYAAQYPQNAASNGSADAAAPQNQQAGSQAQLYGYLQPSYYNQYYAYNQGGSNAGTSSNNYSGYGQAPPYSGYLGYLQAPQSQTPLQKPYEGQAQPIQGIAQGSPANKEKEAEKK